MAHFDFTATYQARTYPAGIAWRVTKYEQYIAECQGHPVWEHDHLEYCDGSCEEPQDNYERVIAHMVGDDTDHTFDVEDLIIIDEDDYCPECGQIGCTALKS